MNILITGISGFFGRNFVKYLLEKNIICNIVGTSLNLNKIHGFNKLFPTIKVYQLDLGSNNFEDMLDSIIQNHNINYIVHSAAIKQLDVCEKNPVMALRINSISSNIIAKISKKNGIKNVIGISTNKVNNFNNIYGISKYLMEETILTNNYSIYKGVNFFWSDGSVLDVWFNKYKNNETLSLRNPNQVRYFNTIDQICETIYNNLNSGTTIILPESVYVINLLDLFNAFTEYFSYDKYEITEQYSFEPEIDTIDKNIIKIQLSKQDIINLIDTHMKLKV
ncbi:UDP-glucose 4 epimerase [Acanthamoeba polyphaga moumouvirus]|uniref:UDP-glucose 4 epimerase n=1 Tax=Acanthamoeba polyphaga moumouvirus TaxID=1269028 RepID=L7RG49_9VIRU|nr:UDP-glucose 4 epimerase [Acanthamoeba polyphaga moumouvirus]AGC01995.1 UDP-glucose 4 epimerase [Acanthamoeba polyphaga moumouvirus]AQN68363.1 UDP-glucose 4 epimerase [Saudi moumouvirus]